MNKVVNNVKKIARFDIVMDVKDKLFGQMNKFIEEFENDQLMNVYLKDTDDESTFYSIYAKKNKIVYSAEGETTNNIMEFREHISNNLANEDIVSCVYEITKQTKMDDICMHEFVDIVKGKLDSLGDHEHLDIDIFKPQTFTKMLINYDGHKYKFIVSVDVIPDDDDMIGLRPPIYEDTRKSSSKKQVMSHVRHIAKTVDPYVDIDTYVSVCVPTMLMNLGNAFSSRRMNVKETDDVVLDRARYRNAKPRNELHEELMAATWHPSRFTSWCLSEDEREEISRDFA
jgi:hypothetical protein